MIRTWPIVFATLGGALALCACSNPKVADPAGTSPKPAPTPAHRIAGLDQQTRDALKREYRALAIKNDCSRSFKDLDGAWRFVGETKTPSYSETLTFSGTRWTSVQQGAPDGTYIEATVGGEIRCLFNNRVLIRTDKVEPAGAFGNVVGEDYPCDLLGDMAMSGDRMLMICYFDWDVRTSAGLEFEYERVGAQQK